MSVERKDDGLTGLSDSMRRQGSAEQLADKVLERIISGQIRPGTSLREAALAEAGGISRNTARETIRILAAGGLVQHFPQRGVRFGFAVVSVPDGEVETPGPLVAEHRNICQLIVDGDTAGCTELLTAHLQRFGDRLYEVFLQRDAESAHEDLASEELHSA